MDDFELRPARDLGLTPRERALSLQRESGLGETATHLLSWTMIRGYLRLYHRVRVEGRAHLPAEPPFVIVANHASHLDAMLLASIVPQRFRDRVFPLAAGDVFFETPVRATFSTMTLNALPMWRRNCGRHALGELRARLVDDRCVFVLFPEGGRSPDGRQKPFKAGVGMLVAGTDVDVVPCHLDGPYRALPKGGHLPRPVRLTTRIGRPCRFADVANDRDGWRAVGAALHDAVAALDPARDAPAHG